ncbi:MAG: SpoIIE family protein phosphatase [Clostridia bacterium]|nr:SpoIIE family protein phosphatase [Clostridia bacterium]
MLLVMEWDHGPEAMKSSKIAVKMLERLLKAGFDKEVSLKLINSTLVANTQEDMYATLDLQILDLYAGNMEFIKNGACPTFIKRNKEVQLLKSLTLPTGILENEDLVVYDYDLEDGDILVMCSDGIIDSNTEYINKELWVKYLLEDIQTEDSQSLANMILGEAVDNGFGVPKDDMTVLVVKVSKK